MVFEKENSNYWGLMSKKQNAFQVAILNLILLFLYVIDLHNRKLGY